MGSREGPMPTRYRIGAAVIGSFCFGFAVLAMAALVRGERHPGIFIAALVMLGAATDYLMAAFNVKGHWPSLWFFYP